ncbi:BON domain-containing protein [Aquabacterium sp. OR-4]|uniref:BON domain-containing protein n=1 Tax=Aquabacterium sp. OR-4 TaxID=2978127 RepID=UPI0021B48A3F|nr:BON domain-containing protein [Aquabacterium sp. OR-4]MDT7835065.1 BON domain-containing protein [Aquabacterium sp. OR-4]
MNRMNRTPTSRSSTLLVAAIAALVLSACSRDDNRTAGQQVDAAIAKTEAATDKAASEIKQESAEAKAAVERSADKAAGALDNAASKVADAGADALITAAVNAELAKDPNLSALKIDVDTRNGRVMLSGTAPSTTARERATSLAASVKGVSSVENRLEVRG